MNPPPLTAILLLTSEPWSRLQVEGITQYVFETLRIPAFATLSTALAASFAYAVQDAVVIDIGKDKTEITPIAEYTPVTLSQRTIKCGSSSINKALEKILPNLTPSQVEYLKKSDIFEVLSEDAAKQSWFGINNPSGMPDSNPENDGIVDVAAIVTSGRTREILAQREKEKEKEKLGQGGENSENEKANEDREFNTFIDANNTVVQVGKERFQGTQELVEKITIAVGEVLKHLDEANRRQECWDNVIIVGRGSSIKGLKEAVLYSLQSRYVISRPTMGSELPSMFNTSGYNTPTGSGTPSYMQAQQPHLRGGQGHGQVPVQIKISKTLDYFPEWKNYGWEEASFLGAQIAAKQMFGGSVEGTYVSRTDYNEMGPAAIWDI